MRLDQAILQNIVEDAMARFDRAPSLSVSVWDGEDVTSAAAGSACVETGIPATPETLYCIGSSSKAFTAASIGILVDQGKLDLDKPVRDYMPDFAMYDEAASGALTVRDMLCHRSGLPRYYVDLILNADLTHTEMARLIAGQQPKWPLRYRFGYSNYMFILAAYLVEHVSGEPFDHFVKTRILEPLHMDATVVYADQIPDGDPRKSSPHEGRGDSIRSVPRMALRNSAGSGSVYSSTPDMIKWLRFRLYGDDSILSEEMRAEAQSPQMLIKKGEIVPWDFPETGLFAYGMGWFIQDYYDFTLLYHDGAVRGYRSMQMFIPGKDIAVSILTNCEATDLVFSLGYTLVDRMLDLPENDWYGRYKDACRGLVGSEEALLREQMEKRGAAAPLFTTSDYAGEYRAPFHGTLCIEERDGDLFANIENNPSPLFYSKEDVFLLVINEIGYHCELSFGRDENGAVDSVSFAAEPELPDMQAVFRRIR